MNWTDDTRKRLYCSETRVEFRPNRGVIILPFFLAVMFMLPPLYWDVYYLSKGMPDHLELLDDPLKLALAIALPALAWALLNVRWGHGFVIDEIGVAERFFFRTRRLDWDQIQDYGFAYAGRGSARLYFAAERLENGSDGKKKFAGQCCGIRLYSLELRYSGQILSVCRRYTELEPYLCTKDGYLSGLLRDR